MGDVVRTSPYLEAQLELEELTDNNQKFIDIVNGIIGRYEENKLTSQAAMYGIMHARDQYLNETVEQKPKINVKK